MCLKKMRAVRQISLTLMVSLGVVYGEPPLNNQYGVPANLPVSSNNHESHGGITNSYGAPLGSNDHHDEHQDYIDSQPKSYEFGYSVKDSATGNDFGRQETSDGETVRGEYRVQLPDGRIQIVTYMADWRTGFHADVRYEGEASYPDQYNNGYNNEFNNNNNNNNNGYNSGYNNFNNNNNNNNNSPGYNYNNPNPTNTYNQGNSNNYNNNGYYNNNNNHNNNNNNYQQYGPPSNQYNGYSGSSTFGSQGPQPTYGTPQFN